MTASESRFQKWYKTCYPNAFIKKLPDMKSGAGQFHAGLPDYLTVNNCETIWWEVKKSDGEYLRLSDFTPAQLVVFHKMLMAGAIIKVRVETKALSFHFQLTINHLENLTKNKKIIF